MAADIVPSNNFYVYILYREDGITPFYVGMGRGNRWMAHEKNPVRGRSYKDNVICAMRDAGIPIRKEKAAEGLTAEEAAALEISLIAKIGRRHDGGPLTNVTGGGDGHLNPTPEHRARMRVAQLGKMASAETREKLRLAKAGFRPSDDVIRMATVAKTGIPKSGAHKAKIALALTGRKLGPRSAEDKAKISAGLTGKKRGRQSDDAQAKRSESLKLSWAAMAPEDKAKRGMNGKAHSEEAKARIGAGNAGKKRTYEQRAKMSAARTGKKLSPETKARMAEAQKKRYQLIREAGQKDG